MLRLNGERIFLAALEREHCRQLFADDVWAVGREVAGAAASGISGKCSIPVPMRVIEA